MPIKNQNDLLSSSFFAIISEFAWNFELFFLSLQHHIKLKTLLANLKIYAYNQTAKETKIPDDSTLDRPASFAPTSDVAGHSKSMVSENRQGTAY
jgi:hypothetical protein